VYIYIYILEFELNAIFDDIRAFFNVRALRSIPQTFIAENSLGSYESLDNLPRAKIKITIPSTFVSRNLYRRTPRYQITRNTATNNCRVDSTRGGGVVKRNTNPDETDTVIPQLRNAAKDKKTERVNRDNNVTSDLRI